MSRISVINENNRIIVANKLSSPEEINLRELDMISREMVEGFIPVFEFKEKRVNYLKGYVEGKVPLKDYLKHVITKGVFLDIVLQIINAIKVCEKNMMYVKNLGLTLEYIFIDTITKELFFIYWPVINSQLRVNVDDFFKDLPFQCVFSRFEDSSYVTEYIKFFRNGKVFSLKKLEELVNKLAGITSEIPQRENTVNYNISTDNFKTNEYESLSLPVDNADISTPNYIRESQVSGLNIENTETEVQVDSCEDGTVMLASSSTQEALFPYLIRVKTGEKIFLNKPIFRIGKDAQYSSYVVTGNNAISRNHADLIIRNYRFYIKDNNSTNKTYVDGKPIPVYEEVEIFPGMKLRLANEEFIFCVNV